MLTVSQRYHPLAILIHWAVALLIILDFVLGLTVDNFPKTWTGAVINVHALVGLAILALTFVRLWWRLRHRPPDYPSDFSLLMRRMSHLVQSALYVLMLAVPLIGIPTLLYRGRGLNFGFFEIPSPFARTPEIFHPLTEVHGYAAYALVALAIGHILAALYHQFILKDRLISRMGPRQR
jgi:cytochrome b561